ncbi:MAG: acyl-CoA/acyl-ACP dehydrogenase [Alphaproteobacteria bacterium]|nr:acyl-CoA/acyl-ACP dehydrogenase [Alphaproteobacteria bacterium]
MTGDFAAQDELQLLQDSARRVLADACPLKELSAGGADAVAIAARHWQLAKAMGWPGLMVPESAGGAGMGCRGLAILAEEMGAQFFCGPFLATAVVGPAIAALAGRRGRMTGLARAIAEGATVLAGAAVPAGGQWIAAAPELGVENDAAPRLSGTRELVEHPALATHFLALEIVRRGADRVGLLAAPVPAGTGVVSVPRQAFDVSCPIASIRFERAAVAPGDVLSVELSLDALTALLRPVHVAIAAELVGVAQSALDRAVAYAKERRQFGQPIGAFQAIKHRLADAFVLVANARLAVRQAARGDDEPASVEAARLLAAEAALKAAGDYIQVQGGMGISWESDAHLHLKRARRLAAAFGTSQGFRQALVDRFVASVLSPPVPPVHQGAGSA